MDLTRTHIFTFHKNRLLQMTLERLSSNSVCVWVIVCVGVVCVTSDVVIIITISYDGRCSVHDVNVCVRM